MAKRDDKTTTGTEGTTGATGDALEQKMVVFAEQLGRIVGTVQAKAEGWLDREALNAQISTVRDSASDLLNQLGGAAKAVGSQVAKGQRAATRKISGKGKVASKARASATSGAPGTKGKGRSGGAVDAPGKKHRKPTPSEAGATGSPRGAGSRIAKLKAIDQSRRPQRRG